MSKKGPKELTPEHKAALAAGRVEGRLIRDYLNALEANKPKRGRRRTPESITKRLGTIDGLIENADPLSRVQLVQERMDLKAERTALNANVDMDELEAGFVKAAKAYSARKGLTYGAWREIGISASVLKQAGISRGGN